MFAYGIMFPLGGYLLSHQFIKSGDFFRISESMLYGALIIGQTAILSSDFFKAKVAANNIFHLIDRDANERMVVSSKQQQQQPMIKSNGNLSIRELYFTYESRPDQPVLNGLSFEARHGQTIALVGSSGCGKSTIIQLLEQFYQSHRGQIVSYKHYINHNLHR